MIGIESVAPTAGNDVLVTYRRSGGFAGLGETLTVYSDGKITVQGRGTQVQVGQATPAELEDLRTLLRSSGFTDLEAEYVARGADLYEYEITVGAGNDAKTVLTTDLAQRPPVLVEVLGQLNRLKAQVQTPSAAEEEI